eukprot:6175912-Pleurochrysis_carterae.AAC.4
MAFCGGRTDAVDGAGSENVVNKSEIYFHGHEARSPYYFKEHLSGLGVRWRPQEWGEGVNVHVRGLCVCVFVGRFTLCLRFDSVESEGEGTVESKSLRRSGDDI